MYIYRAALEYVPNEHQHSHHMFITAAKFAEACTGIHDLRYIMANDRVPALEYFSKALRERVQVRYGEQAISSFKLKLYGEQIGENGAFWASISVLIGAYRLDSLDMLVPVIK